MERISLPDGCLLGLKIKGIGAGGLLGGLGTNMGSIGKQVPLPLCHHYANVTHVVLFIRLSFGKQVPL